MANYISKYTGAQIDDAVTMVRNGTAGGGTSAETQVPSYWLTHLQNKAISIREAMSKAGWNKSAFLFYTDTHWSYNYGSSPALLKWLYKHTNINKVFFGGDVVLQEGDTSEDMSYLWDWRAELRDLPHHSVPGNHDDGNSPDNRWDDAYIYSFLLAAEETPQVVRGDALYYYMDYPAEKTRYLFLDTATKDGNILNDSKQLTWLRDALTGTPDGWHVVAIAHIWRVYDSSYNDAGWSMGAEICITEFEAFNARTGIYANAKGHVEFCIGGHTHKDADFVTDGGIPVIIVQCDSRNVRSGQDCTSGTVTENSVNAVVADYASNTISVIRIGRGSSRIVQMDGSGSEDVPDEPDEPDEPVVPEDAAWKTTTITRTLQTSDDTVAIEWSDNLDGVTYVVFDGSKEVARVTNKTQTVLLNVTAGTHTYKVRPQKSDSEVGNYSSGVTLTTVADVGFTNVLRSSTDVDGNPYNGGIGYVEDLRISTSDFAEKSATGWDTTGFFPIARGQVVRLYNMQYYDLYDTGGTSKRQSIFGYSADRKDCTAAGNGELSSAWNVVLNSAGDVVQFTMVSSWSNDDYLRITAKDINAFSIITVNEEINV